MRNCDVLIVGGGPGGSSAAWQLRRAGANVVLLDRAAFPRLKLCAGWITPQVVRDLELDAASYAPGWLTFERTQVHLRALRLPVPCVQHSIRRVEFDAWLLERAGVPVLHHEVRQVRREGPAGPYVIDDAFRAEYLIGAGGTSCPVYRSLLREAAPRERTLQAVALECELRYDWRDPDCHLWFFERGLPGYAWYVPKRDGWLNVGLGAMAQRLHARGEDLRLHWQRLVAILRRRLAPGLAPEPAGYSYWVRGATRRCREGNAFLVGDAAALATRDMCEGIGPAVTSGLRAARSIIDGTPYVLDDIAETSLGGGTVARWLDRAITGGARAAA